MRKELRTEGCGELRYKGQEEGRLFLSGLRGIAEVGEGAAESGPRFQMRAVTLGGLIYPGMCSLYKRVTHGPLRSTYCVPGTAEQLCKYKLT